MGWSVAEGTASPYRRIWELGVWTLMGLGVLAALVFIKVTTSVVMFLLGFGVALAALVSRRLTREGELEQPFSTVVRNAALGGVGLVALCGYLVTARLATLPLLALVAITSPPVVERLTGQPPPRRQRPVPSDDEPPRRPATRTPRSQEQISPPPPPPPPPPARKVDADHLDLESLSFEDLCMAWRRSFTSLQRARTTEERVAVVNARKAYLDELERRRPDCFTRWMESSPRAAGDPTRFFLPNSNNRREPT